MIELRAACLRRYPNGDRPGMALVVLLADNDPVAHVEVCFQ